jgi:serine/threonine protein phosphatase PrpC
MRLRVGARTDVGRVRGMNEDVYRVHAAQGVFIVCDGMGGCPSGELASALAGDAILERLANHVRTGVPADDRPAGYLPRTGVLADAVRRSNACIYDRARHDSRHAGMGTTVVSVWVADHVASVAHVGDSRAYLWYFDRLIPLTRDHSVGDALEGGHNILLRALGREPDVDVELAEVPVRPGDCLVLCSDGLTRMVSEATLARAIRDLRDPQRVCDHLVDLANENGGTDNITIVMVEVMESWWRRLSDAWRTDAGGTHDAEAHAAV